ncbi:MAG: hypothetical protein JWM11_2573 [Planctomycetaceae bacterium]|nr:hypothetical protein [Planctomycetaceae bacterium]
MFIRTPISKLCFAVVGGVCLVLTGSVEAQSQGFYRGNPNVIDPADPFELKSDSTLPDIGDRPGLNDQQQAATRLVNSNSPQPGSPEEFRILNCTRGGVRPGPQ